MGKCNSDYNSLLNAYNRLVARNRDLQTQYEDKENVWKKQEEHYKLVEQKARKLGEMILVKEKNETFFGQAFSYGTIPTLELLDMARTSYERYNASRTELMRALQQKSEGFRQSYENLKTQYEMQAAAKAAFTSSPSSVADPETGEINEQPIDETAPAPVPISAPVSAQKDIPKSVDYKLQEKAKSGDIEILIEEEDSDVAIADVAALSEMASINASVQLEKSGIKISQSEKKRRKVRENAMASNSTVLLGKDEIMNRLQDKGLAILKIIGSTGISDIDALIEAVQKEFSEDEPMSRGKLDYYYRSLLDAQVLCADYVKHPLKKKLHLFWLSEIGGVIYKELTGEKPVEPQCFQVRKEHDNFEHGYGILALKEILEDSHQFKTVSSSRSANTMNMKDGSKYIADVITTGKDKCYFEYEMDTHHQSDFNVKLNKMASVTKNLNIVVPNTATVKSIISKIEKWIESRGGYGCLPGYKVRLSSISMIKDAIKDGADINSDESWNMVFDLSGTNGSAKPKDIAEPNKKDSIKTRPENKVEAAGKGVKKNDWNIPRKLI